MKPRVAGIDAGFTSSKVVLYDAGKKHWQYLHGTQDAKDGLQQALREANITHLSVVGVNRAAYAFPGFTLIDTQQDSIASELYAQALGAQQLLKETSFSDADWLLVGFGTGVSFSAIWDGRFQEANPLGSHLGGGTIAGLAAVLTIPLEEINNLAKNGTPLDVSVGEAIPEVANQPQGSLVLSHFGKGKAGASREDLAATILRGVATSIARDVANESRLWPKGKTFSHVVYVGTPIARFSVLRQYLEEFHTLLSCDPVFLDCGEYAGALGAYLLGQEALSQ